MSDGSSSPVNDSPDELKVSTLKRKRGRPRSAAVAQKREEAFHLCIQGHPFEEIGRRLGLSKQRAWELVDEALKEAAERNKDRADEMRAQQLEELRAAKLALKPKVDAGDPRSTEVYLRVMEREARLYAIDLSQPKDEVGLVINVVTAFPWDQKQGGTGEVIDVDPPPLIGPGGE